MQKQRKPAQQGPSSGAAPSQNIAAAGAALRARNALANLDDQIQKAEKLQDQSPKRKRKKRLTICECGDPNCRIGPFRTIEIEE